jgi:PBP1b-binding outer membrane lipoprotein LpoB
MKSVLAVLALAAILAGCAAAKGDVCKEEGEGHSEHLVCVKK